MFNHAVLWSYIIIYVWVDTIKFNSHFVYRDRSKLIFVFLSIYRCVQRNGVFRQAMLTAQRHGGQTVQSQDEKPSGSDHEDDKPLDVVGGGDPDSPISAHHHHHHHQPHQPGKSRSQTPFNPKISISILLKWVRFFDQYRFVVFGIGWW